MATPFYRKPRSTDCAHYYGRYVSKRKPLSMSVEQLGAWGDFVGGIAVVAGLVFVGIQLLGANRETRAATIQSSLQMQLFVDAEIAKHTDTWQKVISGTPIEDQSELRATRFGHAEEPTRQPLPSLWIDRNGVGGDQLRDSRTKKL